MFKVVYSVMRGYNVKCILSGAYMLAHWTSDKDYAERIALENNERAAQARTSLGSQMEYR